MAILWTIITFLLPLIITRATSCRKELFYHNTYGYGYGIWCQHINNTNIEELSVYNEIALTINQSHLTLTTTNNLFRNIAKLRELTIIDSTIDIAKKNATTTTTFSKLQHLEKLTIRGVFKQQLPANLLHGLSQLKRLDLQRNGIRNIEQSAFRDLTNLERLDLSHNAIIKQNIFEMCDLINLKVLLLNYNQLETLENSTFNCLPNLEELFLDDNRITHINGLKSITLNKLSMKRNLIERFERINATNLNSLNLEGNRIGELQKNDFHLLINLLDINLSHNLIETVPLNLFQRNVHLRSLNLSGNRIVWLCLTVPTLEILNVSNNSIKMLNRNLTHSYNVKNIDLSFNQIDNVTSDAFSNLQSLQEVNLSHNRLAHFNLGYTHNTPLKKLFLRENRLKNLTANMFRYLNKLLLLDLSMNQIVKFDNAVFNNLISLEILNISYNQLNELNYEVVDPLENLQVLDIEGNLLKTIDYSLIINELPNLDVINVKHNLLSCEFLATMIRYFKQNEINYTINERLEFDKENVGGIKCNEVDSKLLLLNESQLIIVNDSKLISDLYTLKQSQGVVSGGTLTTIIICFLISVAVVVLSLYKMLVWQRRRGYIMDEVELISPSDPYKILS